MTDSCVKLLTSYGLPSKKAFVVFLGLTLLVVLMSTSTFAMDFVGGLYSVKVIELSGTSTGTMVVERSGVTGAGLLVGLAPAVGTLSPTNLVMDGGTKATLRGQVADMNGFPSASAYFEWGYSLGDLVNSTATQMVSSTGTYATTIEEYDPNKTVYYRFVAEADGTNYGAIKSFQAEGSVATSYRMLIILPLVWLAIAALLIWGLTSSGLPLVAAAVIGAIMAIWGAIGARVILESLLQWW